MGEQLNLTATEDVLRRRNKPVLEDIAMRYPGLGLHANIKRPLGEAKTDLDGVGELANVAVKEAREDLSDLHAYLANRVRMLARIRLVAGITSTISSASVIALLLGKDSGQTIAASITLISALVGLCLVYVEDFSGGDGSLRDLREKMIEETRKLAILMGDLKLAEKIDDREGVIEVLRKTNVVFGEVQFVRAKVGLPV